MPLCALWNVGLARVGDGATGDQSLCSVSAPVSFLVEAIPFRLAFTLMALVGFLTLALGSLSGFFAFALVAVSPLLIGLGHGLSSHSAGWGKASHPDRTAFPEWLPIGPG